MDRWNGKVAVVTGAAGGIGSAIVRKLLVHNFIVVGLSFTEQKLKIIAASISETFPSAKFYPIRCDVTSEKDVVESFEYISNNIGPVSVLINNAGVSTQLSLLESTSDLVNMVLQTNITGTILCAREAVKIMLKNSIDDGQIININSVVGHIPATPPLPSTIYTASKHSVRIITEGLRQELQERNTLINVTNLSPGAVDTDIMRHVSADYKLNPEDIANSCVTVLQCSSKVSITQLTISSVQEPPF